MSAAGGGPSPSIRAGPPICGSSSSNSPPGRPVRSSRSARPGSRGTSAGWIAGPATARSRELFAVLQEAADAMGFSVTLKPSSIEVRPGELSRERTIQNILRRRARVAAASSCSSGLDEGPGCAISFGTSDVLVAIGAAGGLGRSCAVEYPNRSRHPRIRIWAGGSRPSSTPTRRPFVLPASPCPPSRAQRPACQPRRIDAQGGARARPDDGEPSPSLRCLPDSASSSACVIHRKRALEVARRVNLHV